LTSVSSVPTVLESSPRWTRFIAIGFLGFLLQLTALALLTSGARWTWLPATLVSVELAVVHNFLWHARWTWRDRPGALGASFVRFQLANGVASIAGNAATPPPQEDVVSSRVIARTDDSLRVSIRLVRRAIVTVTYDTEHEMRVHRWTPRLATARSVATRIEEVGGSDHGFLWRLHSYWRYEEIDGGVLVELESLTLSRDVPAIMRPIAAPLVTGIARESVMRTLEALRRYLSAAEDTGAQAHSEYALTSVSLQRRDDGSTGRPAPTVRGALRRPSNRGRAPALRLCELCVPRNSVSPCLCGDDPSVFFASSVV
jgi:hypothetical protein